MFIQKKERKLKKGSGYHVDQLILGGITFLGGLLGMPWMCAAAVRTVAHVSALTVYSRTHAPGEKPQLLGVKEQRVTNFCVHLLIGESCRLTDFCRLCLLHVVDQRSQKLRSSVCGATLYSTSNILH